jgi:hypothetical protein
LDKFFIAKIISGGQTGVDRAALDVAIKLSIPHGGWCPKGRKAEDGIIPFNYQLQETLTDEYNKRTSLNVRDSDGTLIFIKESSKGGTKLTINKALEFEKPYIIYNITDELCIEKILTWIVENNIHILNIAGPRESESPNIYSIAYVALEKLLASKPFHLENIPIL